MGTLSCNALKYHTLTDSSRHPRLDLPLVTKQTALHLCNPCDGNPEISFTILNCCSLKSKKRAHVIRFAKIMLFRLIWVVPVFQGFYTYSIKQVYICMHIGKLTCYGLESFVMDTTVYCIAKKLWWEDLANQIPFGK